MASRKKLVSAIQSLLTTIDLDAPVEPEPVKTAVSKSEDITPDIQPKTPQHIRDIVGDLSLDLD